MDEAVDQRMPILYPAREDWDYRIDRLHGDLAREHSAGAVLTIPLQIGGRFFGAMTFERSTDADFDSDSIEFCDCVAAVLGPILEEKRRNSRLLIWKMWESSQTQLARLLGPRYLGRKVAAIAAR